MHELSLCRSIIEIIENSAKDYKGKQVKTIHLDIGQLAGVDRHALLFGFEVASIGTIAENAALTINDISGRGFCERCGEEELHINHFYDPCPVCCHYPLNITQGEELKVKSIEVE